MNGYVFSKEKVNGDRRDGSGLKRTCYFSRGPKFGIQTYTVAHSHPFQGAKHDLMCTQSCRQTTQTEIK